MKTLLAISLLLFSISAFSEPAPVLRNNPFVWPKKFVEQAPQQAAKNIEAVQINILPVLKSVLIRNDFAVVNMDGQLVEVGQRHRGYRLLGVTNSSVVVGKDGAEFTLSLDSTRGVSDENAATN